MRDSLFRGNDKGKIQKIKALKLKPDHKTIAEFQRKNKEALANVLKRCAKICIKLNLIEGNWSEPLRLDTLSLNTPCIPRLVTLAISSLAGFIFSFVPSHTTATIFPLLVYL